MERAFSACEDSGRVLSPGGRLSPRQGDAVVVVNPVAILVLERSDPCVVLSDVSSRDVPDSHLDTFFDKDLLVATPERLCRDQMARG